MKFIFEYPADSERDDEATASAMYKAVRDAGINFFDSATEYSKASTAGVLTATQRHAATESLSGALDQASRLTGASRTARTSGTSRATGTAKDAGTTGASGIFPAAV